MSYSLITGGAGFIGSNLAHRLLSRGEQVFILDNLSRKGVESNLQNLQAEFPDRLFFEQYDISKAPPVRFARQARQVFHFAAQVAVTTSLDDPLLDFETNVRGTLNLLEALRSLSDPPALVFTSTNKVYGSLEDIPMAVTRKRYRPAGEAAPTGVSEARPLDFHTPYGCSKGAADQYVLDYARSYRIPATVFRMSCIYGPRQCGNEDQGWVAHFLLRALAGETITIYGDGMQVRDVLFVDDLLDALELAACRIAGTAGQAFNIGGGPPNTISLLELVDLIAHLRGSRPDVVFAPWRQGDQRYYVSDTRKFRQSTGWRPAVSASEGVARLYRWLAAAHQPHAILTAQS